MSEDTLKYQQIDKKEVCNDIHILVFLNAADPQTTNNTRNKEEYCQHNAHNLTQSQQGGT